MKKIFSCLLLLFLTTALGQNWNWVVNLPNTNSWYPVTAQSLGIDANDNIYIIDNQTQLFKFDPGGALTWKISLPSYSIKSATDEQGNTYLVSGNYVRKYDTNGNAVWTFSVNTHILRQIAIHPQGGVVVTGWTSPNTGTIHRIDDDGNILWNRYGDFFSDNSSNNSAVCTPKGEVYVIGQMTVSTGSVGKIIKLDSLGTYMSGITTPDFPCGLTLGKDLGMYVLGQHSTGSLQGYSFVLSYDSLGNLLWSKELNYKNISAADIATDILNNVYVTGTFLQTLLLDDLTLTSNGYGMFIVKADTDGNFVWGKTTNSPPNSGQALPVSMKFNHQHQLIIAGEVDGIVYFDSIVVNRPSSYGDVLLCSLSPYTALNVSEWSKEINFDCYPNPVNKLFNVYLGERNKTEITIYNNSGENVYSHIFTSQNGGLISIDMELYPKGLYFMMLTSENKREVKKIMKE